MAFQVQSLKELLQPAAISAFRKNGFIVVNNFVDGVGSSTNSLLDRLTAACTEAAKSRGTRMLPAMDDTGSQFSAQLEHKKAFSPNVQRKAEEVENAPGVEFHTKKVHLKYKHQRQVDRAFRKLTKQRQAYRRLKNLPTFVSEAEEMSGEVSDERIAEIKAKLNAKEVYKTFENYRDSGMMEQEIRREHHIGEAFEIMNNWSKGWCQLWPEYPEVRSMLLEKGVVGASVGEAATALSGEMMMRLYGDALYEFTPFTGAQAFCFIQQSVNFQHPHAMTALLQLRHHSQWAMEDRLVLQGSHHVIRAATRDGKDCSRFRLNNVFDVGKLVREVPELASLPVVEIPPLQPGSALFLNNYLMSAVQPAMTGNCNGAFVPPIERPVVGPSQYALSLMPDRCTFDGEKNSWASRDSHGPLYSYKKGQLLNDNAIFPVLYSAMDVE